MIENNTDTIYCSRKCASIYTFSDNRREVLINSGLNSRFTKDISLEICSDGLRVREWNKYDQIHRHLFYSGIPHYFEYLIPNTRYIFDLVLFDLNLLIEFDERHHQWQQQEDLLRDNIVSSLGWNIYRIIIPNSMETFPVELIKPVLSYYD